MHRDPRLPYIRTNPNAPYLPPNYCPPEGSYATASDTEMGSFEIGDTKQIIYSRPFVVDPLNPDENFFNPNTREVGLDAMSLSLKGERPWVVSINASEIFSFASEAPVTVPSSGQQILSEAGTSRYSTLQAIIKVADGSANSKIIKVDIAGGTTIPVIGRNVQVSILAPSTTQVVEKENQTLTQSLEGIVYNTIISAKVAPLLNSNGNFDILKYTVHQYVPAEAVSFVEIPPSARRVRIINATVDFLTTRMYFWMTNNITLGHNMGIIDFLFPNTPNSTLEINIPAGATHIHTGPADERSGRAFSFVFLIDP